MEPRTHRDHDLDVLGDRGDARRELPRLEARCRHALAVVEVELRHEGQVVAQPVRGLGDLLDVVERGRHALVAHVAQEPAVDRRPVAVPHQMPVPSCLERVAERDPHDDGAVRVAGPDALQELHDRRGDRPVGRVVQHVVHAVAHGEQLGVGPPRQGTHDVAQRRDLVVVPVHAEHRDPDVPGTVARAGRLAGGDGRPPRAGRVRDLARANACSAGPRRAGRGARGTTCAARSRRSTSTADDTVSPTTAPARTTADGLTSPCRTASTTTAAPASTPTRMRGPSIADSSASISSRSSLDLGRVGGQRVEHVHDVAVGGDALREPAVVAEVLAATRHDEQGAAGLDGRRWQDPDPGGRQGAGGHGGGTVSVRESEVDEGSLAEHHVEHVVGALRDVVPAPGDVMVGPDEDEVGAVELPDVLVVEVDDRQRDAARAADASNACAPVRPRRAPGASGRGRCGRRACRRTGRCSRPAPGDRDAGRGRTDRRPTDGPPAPGPARRRRPASRRTARRTSRPATASTARRSGHRSARASRPPRRSRPRRRAPRAGGSPRASRPPPASAPARAPRPASCAAAARGRRSRAARRRRARAGPRRASSRG